MPLTSRLCLAVALVAAASTAAASGFRAAVPGGAALGGGWDGGLGGGLGGLPFEARAPAVPRWPGLVGAPFLRYAPETAWGFGAGGMAWFHADPVARAAGRATTVGAVFQQTTRRQTVGALQWDAWLADATWRSTGAVFAERWPYDFFGAGGAAVAGAPERYTQRTLKLDTGLTRLVWPAGEAPAHGLWTGVRLQWRRDALADATPGGLVDRCAVDGCRGARVAAAQAVLAWDTRDRVCGTQEGLSVAVRAGGALPVLGGETRAGELELDARGWRRLPLWRAVASAQARLQSVTGPVPFYLLPTFGGDRALRGVVEGRHRDRTAALVQAELAVPLWWRLGLELFGGAGEAAPRPGALSWRGLVPAGGAGLRFTVDPVERVYLRVDHGVSRGSAQWYLSIGQAI